MNLSFSINSARVLCLALRRGRPLLRRSQCLALRDDERMCTRKIGRKRISQCPSPMIKIITKRSPMK